MNKNYIFNVLILVICVVFLGLVIVQELLIVDVDVKLKEKFEQIVVIVVLGGVMM